MDEHHETNVVLEKKILVAGVMSLQNHLFTLLQRRFHSPCWYLVVNYNLPTKFETGEPDYEVYLHRVGRAGRFGRKGAVFNLLLDDARDKEVMDKIEKYFGAYVKEIKSWKSEEEYKSALKEAGLLD